MGYNECEGKWEVQASLFFPNPTTCVMPLLNLTRNRNRMPQVRNTLMAKRGQPNKVGGTFMSRCNAFGISPFENEKHLNLRTVTSGTRERLQKKADERHGWALQESREQVDKLTRQIGDKKYTAMLEKKAVVMRAQRQRNKDRDSLKQGESRQNKLQELVTAAERATKELERRLRIEAKEGEKARRGRTKRKAWLRNMQTQLQAKCDDKKKLVVEVELVRKKEKELETRLENMGSEYKGTCDEMKHVQGQFDNWKALLDIKQRVTKKKRLQDLQSERDATAKVSCCPVANILM